MSKHEQKPLTMLVWPDAGRKLGISRNAAYEAARRGQIPTIWIGKRLLVPRAAFERLLEGIGASEAV
jgi:hypothetical protein